MGYERNRLREVRAERCMSQVELARRSRVSMRTISMVESGARCRQDTKRKLLHGLRMTWAQRRRVWPLMAPLYGQD